MEYDEEVWQMLWHAALEAWFAMETGFDLLRWEVSRTMENFCACQWKRMELHLYRKRWRKITARWAWVYSIPDVLMYLIVLLCRMFSYLLCFVPTPKDVAILSLDWEVHLAYAGLMSREAVPHHPVPGMVTLSSCIAWEGTPFCSRSHNVWCLTEPAVLWTVTFARWPVLRDSVSHSPSHQTYLASFSSYTNGGYVDHTIYWRSTTVLGWYRH